MVLDAERGGGEVCRSDSEKGVNGTASQRTSGTIGVVLPFRVNLLSKGSQHGVVEVAMVGIPQLPYSHSASSGGRTIVPVPDLLAPQVQQRVWCLAFLSILTVCWFIILFQNGRTGGCRWCLQCLCLVTGLVFIILLEQ